MLCILLYDCPLSLSFLFSFLEYNGIWFVAITIVAPASIFVQILMQECEDSSSVCNLFAVSHSLKLSASFCWGCLVSSIWLFFFFNLKIGLPGSDFSPITCRSRCCGCLSPGPQLSSPEDGPAGCRRNTGWCQSVISVAQSCPTLCDPMNCSTPGLPVHHQLPEFTQTHVIESVMPSSNLILCCPLLLLPPIPPSIRVFSNESTLRVRWPKYWSFSFSISPSNEHPGLISFRMDWLDLLAVQGTLKSLSNNTVQKHQVFSAQLSL